MTERWFFASGGEKAGPFSALQLKGFAARGTLLPTDTVWKEGVERGSLAARVRHLFPHSEGTTLPAKVTVSTGDEPAPFPQKGAVLPTAISSTAAQFASPPTSLTDHEACDDRGEYTISQPPGLKRIFEDDGAECPDTPGPNDAPASEWPAQVKPAASPALISAPYETPSGPGNAGAYSLDAPHKVVGKQRATAMSNAVIVSQDGTSVRYRKKCGKCGHHDETSSTMRIKNGTTRVRFICPRCRGGAEVVIQAGR
jgi:hypothetical protein